MKFSKYSSSGNDFVIMQRDKFSKQLSEKSVLIKLCHRNFGVGADGVIFVHQLEEADFDFEMEYFNSDGGEVEMCGNGARAACFFARDKMNLPLRDKLNGYRFKTQNGVYQGAFRSNEMLELEMSEISDLGLIDVADLDQSAQIEFIRVGVPHVVINVGDGEEFDLGQAKKIRYDKRFSEGTNVNFIKVLENNKISVRTYERGVEAETLSCGTGVTSCGVLMMHWNPKLSEVEVITQGGSFRVLKKDENTFLIGSTNHLFDGILAMDFLK